MARAPRRPVSQPSVTPRPRAGDRSRAADPAHPEGTPGGRGAKKANDRGNRRRAGGNPPALSRGTPLKATLNPSQRTFCLEWLRNGHNATAAYKAAYPGATPSSARELGHRLLTKVDIRTFLAVQLEPVWKAMQMDGDEATARMAAIARADIADCHNEQGALLKPHDWPPAVRMAVESYDIAGKVKLASRLQALRTILELTGKVRSTADSIDDLAAAMRADREKHAKS